MKNPFQGPKPFREGDSKRFFGRDQDWVSLYHRFTSDRVVVVHAETGAGKSSLIHAGLIPLLSREGYLVAGSLRPQDLSGEDFEEDELARWVAGSIGESLKSFRLSSSETEEDLAARQESWRRLGFTSESLKPALHGLDGAPSVALCIDQTEEVFRHSVTWVSSFFRWLGNLLRDERIWLILVIRNSHLAELLQHSDCFVDELRSRFPLPLLSIEDSTSIIRQTLKASGEPELPESMSDTELMQLLRDASADSVSPLPLGLIDNERQKIVLPLFLQVHCFRWFVRRFGESENSNESGDSSESDDSTVASTEPLKWLVDEEIQQAIRRSKGDLQRDEEALRDWCEGYLIDGFGRRPAHLPADGKPRGVSSLLDGYLVTRVSKGRVELAHDAFVSALKESNRTNAESRSGFLASRARAWRIHRRSREAGVSLLGPFELARAAKDYRNASASERRFFRVSANTVLLPVWVAIAVVLTFGAVFLVSKAGHNRRMEGFQANEKSLREEIDEQIREKECQRLRSDIYTQAISAAGFENHSATLRNLLSAASLAKDKICETSVAPAFADIELLRFAERDFLVSTRTVPLGILEEGDGISGSDQRVVSAMVEVGLDSFNCSAGERTYQNVGELPSGPLKLEVFPADIKSAFNAGWSRHRRRELFTLAYSTDARRKKRKVMLSRASEAKARERLFRANERIYRGRFIDFSMARLEGPRLTAASGFRDGQVMIWELNPEDLIPCHRRGAVQCPVIELRASLSLGSRVVSGCIGQGGREVNLLTADDMLVTVRLESADYLQVLIDGKVRVPAEQVARFSDQVFLVTNAHVARASYNSLAGTETSQEGQGILIQPKFRSLEEGSADLNVALIPTPSETGLFQIRRNGEVWWRDRDSLDTPQKLKHLGKSVSIRQNGVPNFDLKSSGTLSRYGHQVYFGNGISLGKSRAFFVRDVTDSGGRIALPDLIVIRATNDELLSRFSTWRQGFETTDLNRSSASGLLVTAVGRAGDSSVLLGVIDPGAGSSGLCHCEVLDSLELRCEGPQFFSKKRGEITALSASEASAESPSMLAVGFASGTLALMPVSELGESEILTPSIARERATSGISALYWWPSELPFLGDDDSADEDRHGKSVRKRNLVIGTRGGQILVQIVPRAAIKLSSSMAARSPSESLKERILLPPILEIFKGADPITFLNVLGGPLFFGDSGGGFRVLRPNWRGKAIERGCRHLADLKELHLDQGLEDFCIGYLGEV